MFPVCREGLFGGWEAEKNINTEKNAEKPNGRAATARP